MMRRNTDKHIGESGQILVMTAIMLPVLIGFMALVLDAGYAFDCRRQAQTAADSAALAGAYAVDFNSSISQGDLETIVRADAARNGFTHDTDGVRVKVYWQGSASDAPSPSNGGFEFDYTGDTTAVGVSILQPKAMFLMRVLNAAFANVAIGAKAVANKGGASDINVVALNRNASFALWADDTDSHMSFTGTLIVNSTGGTAAVVCATCSVSADGGVFVTGGWTGTITPTPINGFPAVNDPFASLPAPVIGALGWANIPQPQGCNSGSKMCSPGVYHTGILLDDGGTYTFEAGNYYIEGGGLHFKNGVQAIGTGVTIYNAGNGGTTDGFDLDSPGTLVRLTGPSAAGPYRSIVYFQGRGNSEFMTVSEARPTSGGGLQLNGVVYVPNVSAGLQFLNGGSGNGTAHSILVTNVLRLRGGSLVLDNDFTSFGGSPLKKISLAE